jgi:hypothetical protein
MKKTLILLITLFSLINTANACMPFTPESIVIWEYNGIIEKEFPYERFEEWEYQFIDFNRVEKPFSKLYMKLWKYYYIDTSRIDLKDYKNWDLIITISDYSNWDYEDYFGVFEMWKISCNNNDDFFIENIQWYIKSFWKEAWQCGNYRPDNVQSEEELLEKIKEKYKTCKNIGIKNTYTRNIDDDFKIYEFEQKVWTIIEKSKNIELLKSKLIKKVIKLLWKDKKELDSIHNFNDYELESFKEYALIKIYRYLSYWDLIRYDDSEVKILENDILRVLVTLPNIKIDNNSVYYIWNSWNKIRYIEFFKMNINDKVEEFINTNILEEEFIWKCKSYEIVDHNISFTNNIIYGIWAYWDYKSTTRDLSDCWKYWESYWIKYFERIWNYLIYVNAWQDYNWVDFSLIEFK